MTPAGGAVPLVNLFLGEVIFGGVGSGLYGMFFYIIIAVFVAGLMVGRTPEWLGQEDRGARDQVRGGRGALRADDGARRSPRSRSSTKSGLASIFNTGVHGFTETLYAYDSQGNNNGSAFAGFGLTNFSADLGTIAMLLGRFVPMFAALALGGALAKKKIVPASAGTFRTDGADLRRAARRRDRAHRRPDDLPGPDARADRRRADALMRNVAQLGRSRSSSSPPSSASATRSLMTGFAQVAFKSQANGSLITVERQGRRLEARRPGVHEPAYFHERPSATSPAYNAAGTTLREPRPDEPGSREERRRPPPQAILKLEGPYNPGLTIHDIPVDAVTTSGSGIDPDISPAYAQLQSRADRRRAAAAARDRAAADHAAHDGRSWGFFGEPGVNVLELNIALDKESE